MLAREYQKSLGYKSIEALVRSFRTRTEVSEFLKGVTANRSPVGEVFTHLGPGELREFSATVHEICRS
jgi:hypothetical protein